MPLPRQARHRDAPIIPDGCIGLDPRLEDRHFLHGAMHGDKAPVVLPLEFLVCQSPPRTARGPLVGEPIRKRNELVAQHAAPLQPGIPVIEVGDGDVGPGTEVIVNLIFEETRSAGVGVVLEVVTYPAVSISCTLRKHGRGGIQEQPGCFGCGARHNDEVRRLSPAPIVAIKVLDGAGPPPRVEIDV